MQVAWDIPTNLVIPSLYSPIMIGHHLGMVAAGFVGLMPFAQFYFPFFVGVVEVSSIPLAVVDIFHPSKFGARCGAAAWPCRRLRVSRIHHFRMHLLPRRRGLG